MTMNPPRVQPYATVQKLWPGETFVILGGGSSLTPADVAFVRGKARVVAIKEAGACSLAGCAPLAPWADVLYAADEKYWQFERGAPAFAGLKYAIEPQRVPWPDVQVLRNTGTDGMETDPSGLRTGYNSGYQAIQLAVHLGAAKIILLGFDMWRGPGGQANWFGPHPNHVDSPYPLFLQAFASIVAPLKAAGVQVVNCSRFTLLRAFPQLLLEEAFA